MFINEYGNSADPTVILLAPMMVTGSELYHLMQPYWNGSYYMIAPDQGGHGKAGPYTSAEREYKLLRDYLLATDRTQIALVYGASLGGAVGYRLFTDPDLNVEHAWFDGVTLCENARFAEWFMKKMFRSRKRKLAVSKTEASDTLVSAYGYDFAKMMTGNYRKMTTDDIDAICHACCHYRMRKLSDNEQKKLHLDFGEKDFDWKYARKTVPVYMPGADVKIRPGYAHCGYMAAEPENYVHQIEAFMEEQKDEA